MYVNTPFPTCHLLSTHTCTHISSQLSFPRVLSSSHPHRPTIWCQSAGSLTPPRPSSTLEHVALSFPAASLSVWKKIALRLVHRTPMGKVWDKHTISILPSCLEGGLKTYEPGSLEENRVYPRQWPHFVLKVTSFARKIPQQVGSLGVIVYQHEMHMFSSKNLKTGFCGFVIAGYLRHSEDLCQHLKVCRGDWTGSPLYQGIRKLHCRGECSIRHSTSVYISANYTFGIMSAVIPCSQFQSKHYP